MCVLKIYSDTFSFKEFAGNTKIPIFSIFDKGEYRDQKRTRQVKENTLSIDVSDKEWDDFPGQVSDAIGFLSKHHDELFGLLSRISDVKGCLDFPIYSRLNSNIINQNDYIPSELVCLAGKLNLDIGMSQYSKEAFE